MIAKSNGENVSVRSYPHILKASHIPV